MIQELALGQSKRLGANAQNISFLFLMVDN